jgi:hypothetical protein
MQPFDNEFTFEKLLYDDHAGGAMAEKNNRVKDNNGNAECSDTDLFHSGGGFFEVHVKGQLDSRWSDWLEGLEVRLLENGEMILFGPIVDQAALIGVLNKLNRLNLTLLSVNNVNRNINMQTK